MARFQDLLRREALAAAAASSSSSGPAAAPSFCRGTSLYDFTFTDQTAALRGIYSDCSMVHGFKVRGQSYLRDKVKISAGPALFKLVHYDYITYAALRPPAPLSLYRF